MLNHDKYKCRVCGFDHYPDLPWGENGEEPSHNICECCGIEFGYADNSPPGDPSTLKHLASIREHWVKIDKCKWSSPEFKPVEWDMPAQIRGISPEFAAPSDEDLIAYYLKHWQKT